MTVVWAEFGEERGLTEPVRETVREMADEFPRDARPTIATRGPNGLRFLTFGACRRRRQMPRGPSGYGRDVTPCSRAGGVGKRAQGTARAWRRA